jgi:hypothetical protein
VPVSLLLSIRNVRGRAVVREMLTLTATGNVMKPTLGTFV